MTPFSVFILFFVNKEKNQKKNFLRKTPFCLSFHQGGVLCAAGSFFFSRVIVHLFLKKVKRKITRGCGRMKTSQYMNIIQKNDGSMILHNALFGSVMRITDPELQKLAKELKEREDSYSLHFDHLWVSVLMSNHCKKMHL